MLISASLTTMLSYALYIILALGILMLMITIHEFGHYLSGKMLGFKINEFAIGFGPKLYSKKKKNGEIFSIRAIPLGGYCAFEGEQFDEETEKAENQNKTEGKSETSAFRDVGVSDKNPAPPKPQIETKAEPADVNVNPNLKKFNDQHPWRRIVVLISGGAFNLISAVIFSFIFLWAVGLTAPSVGKVELNGEGVAYATDAVYGALKEGDVIVAVNGKRATYLKSIYDINGEQEGETRVFTILRDGSEMDFTLTAQKIGDEEGKRFGFMFGKAVSLKHSFVDSLKYCVPYTGKMSVAILQALGQLITGKQSITGLSGPVGTISTIAEYSSIDWRNIFALLPLIAANLGIFNLMPIPALDGSKVVFCGIEWVRKKPVSRKVESMIHAAGILLLLGLVIFVDIFNIFIKCG